MSRRQDLTLDDAIAAYDSNPCRDTAEDLRHVAQEYADDEMISESEAQNILAGIKEQLA